MAAARLLRVPPAGSACHMAADWPEPSAGGRAWRVRRPRPGSPGADGPSAPTARPARRRFARRTGSARLQRVPASRVPLQSPWSLRVRVRRASAPRRAQLRRSRWQPGRPSDRRSSMLQAARRPVSMQGQAHGPGPAPRPGPDPGRRAVQASSARSAVPVPQGRGRPASWARQGWPLAGRVPSAAAVPRRGAAGQVPAERGPAERGPAERGLGPAPPAARGGQGTAAPRPAAGPARPPGRADAPGPGRAGGRTASVRRLRRVRPRRVPPVRRRRGCARPRREATGALRSEARCRGGSPRQASHPSGARRCRWRAGPRPLPGPRPHAG